MKIKSFFRQWGHIVAAVVLLLVTFVAPKAGALGPATDSPRKIVTGLVEQIQRADYEADRPALRRLYQQLDPFTKDKELGAKVRYWRGFALWRRALNGFIETPAPTDLEQDLSMAVTEFDAAVAGDPGFVDAKVGAASCIANMAFMAYTRKDMEHAREYRMKSDALLKEAEAMQPDNPRLLWVLGANRWYTPPERGGGEAAAIETYKKGLEAARAHRRESHDVLMPSWGEPELLMNLSWANLNSKTPDLDAAEQYGRAALAQVPYWHYVKDVLLPKIAAVRPTPANSPKK
jgi:hypothetical protein